MVSWGGSIIIIMKKFLLLLPFILLMAVSCRAEIETHVDLNEIKLPLTGIQFSQGSIEFYVQKEFDIQQESDIEIDDIIWSYQAVSNGTISYQVKISAVGQGSDGLFAVCSPENLCLPIRGTYASPPDYVVNAPVIFQGQIRGGIHEFSNIHQDPAANEEMQKALENGKIWVILKVTATSPTQFLNGDTLKIENLHGDLKLHKNLDYLFPLSGLFF